MQPSFSTIFKLINSDNITDRSIGYELILGSNNFKNKPERQTLSKKLDNKKNRAEFENTEEYLKICECLKKLQSSIN